MQMAPISRRQFLGAAAVTVGTMAGSSPAIVGVSSRGDYKLADDFTSDAELLSALRDGDKLVFRSGKTYERTTTLRIIAKSIHVDASTARFLMRDNKQAVEISSGFSGPWSLAENYVPGSTRIVLTGVRGRLSDYFYPGKPLRIVSDAIDPLNRNQGTQARQYRTAEWGVVEGVQDGANALTLAAPLRFVHGLDPAARPPDPENREVVESYTRANHARVLTSIKEGFAWEGGIIEYEDGHDASDGTGWRATCLTLTGFVSPQIEGLAIDRGYSKGILVSSFKARIKSTRVRNLSDFSRIGGTSSNLGYGHCDAGSLETVWIAPYSENTRHAYTSASMNVPINAQSTAQLMYMGRTVDSSIIDGVGVGNRSSIWDAHLDSDGTIFTDCRAKGGGSYGFTARGRGIRFVRPISDCDLGINVFSEWAMHGGSDLPAHSGNGAPSLTSCVVESAQVTCRKEAVVSSASRTIITGNGDFRCRTHRAFWARGGFVHIANGLQRVSIGGVQAAESSSVGVFHATAAADEFGVDWQPGFHVGHDADVIVDAANATDQWPMRLFDLAEKTCWRQAGRISATLNNGFDYVVHGGVREVDEAAEIKVTGGREFSEKR